MSQSTAPAARGQILALLTAALPATRVTWGGPTETEDIADEMVYLGNVVRTVETRGFGQPATRVGSFGEEYRFPVIAIGKHEGDDEQTAEQRAWALVDVVEQAIRGDLSLGGVLNNHAEFGDQQITTESLTDGWLYRASVEIVCQAVI